jgi:acetyl-CoA carboxylase biotin carboxylase subunit
MFSKILIANRGEIALRIIRTASEMGIRTVAVHSEADRDALHALSADESYHIGPAAPSASYLNMENIIDAAKQSGAHAIHPGYGFLAENPAFAQRVADEGLIFIGPTADVMAKLGDKTTARQIMAKTDAPIIPGLISSETDPDKLAKSADEIGFPVLIKASAGGGGKGMRVVDDPKDLLEAAELASSEALSAFGDGAIYLEKYLDKPRHVEFQILADSHGNVVHCFERECSIQRRHQKIIEETPSPALDEELRERMGQAAIQVAKASGYLNAGTVEFLLDGSGNFYFLEVNARLQVEHPITEMITGLDLVRRQIEIAAGMPLPFRQEELTRTGHAIECRIYAEDPEMNFMPSSGKILYFRPPEGPGIRYDHGVYTGFNVPPNYDPIIGKLVTWSEDRPTAIERMLRALKEAVILGVKTPVEYLMDILASEPFREGATHTHFIEEHFSHWKPDEAVAALAAKAFVANDMLGVRTRAGVARERDRLEELSPWRTLGPWNMIR